MNFGEFKDWHDETRMMTFRTILASTGAIFVQLPEQLQLATEASILKEHAIRKFWYATINHSIDSVLLYANALPDIVALCIDVFEKDPERTESVLGHFEQLGPILWQNEITIHDTLSFLDPPIDPEVVDRLHFMLSSLRDSITIIERQLRDVKEKQELDQL